MQNRYVGDIGDFVKFAILRALLQGGARRLGVLWWLHPDEIHNADGKHRHYLSRPSDWRHYDPALFDALREAGKASTKHISMLERASLLAGACYFDELLPVGFALPDRSRARHAWFEAARSHVQDCDLVFLDPDNGIASHRVKPTQRRAGKSVLVEELQALRKRGRALVVYHHQSRFPGGHDAEFTALARRLEQSGLTVTGALRASPFSPRLFLIIDGDDRIRANALRIAEAWHGKIRWLEPA